MALELSRLAAAMPTSPIRKLIPLSDETEKNGIKVYRLNIGQPDIDSPKEAFEALQNTGLKFVSYPNSAGEKSLLEAMVKYYSKFDITLDTKCINVMNGGSEALQVVFSVICNPGDKIIVFEPFYTNYATFAVETNIKFEPITTTIETGFALPPISEIEKHISPEVKAIMVCNPSNPTGALYSKKDMEQIAQIAKKHNLFIISDEVYREFCYSDEKYFSALNLEGVDDNVIVIDSVSKRFNLCGTRVGFVVSKNKDVMTAVLKFALARLCSPKLGQMASVGALKVDESYYTAVREEYIRRRNLLVSELNKIPGVLCPTPNGAFYAPTRLPVDDAEKFAKWMLTDFNYNGKTVLLTPMAGFYATPGMGINEVRIAYVLKEEDIIGAVECLAKGLEAYPGRTI